MQPLCCDREHRQRLMSRPWQGRGLEEEAHADAEDKLVGEPGPPRADQLVAECPLSAGAQGSSPSETLDLLCGGWLPGLE